MTVTDQTPFPPGARIVVRDTEWLVRSCAPTKHDGYQIRVTGVSEFVRDEDAVFFTAIEDPKPVLLRPEQTTLVRDDTPGFADGQALPGGDAPPHPAAAVRARPLGARQTASCSTRLPTSSVPPSSR